MRETEQLAILRSAVRALRSGLDVAIAKSKDHSIKYNTSVHDVAYGSGSAMALSTVAELIDTMMREQNIGPGT